MLKFGAHTNIRTRCFIPSAAAPHADITRLTAHKVLGRAAEGLCLVDSTGPCSNGGAIVRAGALPIRGALTGCTIRLLPDLKREFTRFLLQNCPACHEPRHRRGSFRPGSNLCSPAASRSCSSFHRIR